MAQSLHTSHITDMLGCLLRIHPLTTAPDRFTEFRHWGHHLQIYELERMRAKSENAKMRHLPDLDSPCDLG